jgi:protein-S-isoprenylcysteine O-methyltransferase Ste14
MVMTPQVALNAVWLVWWVSWMLAAFWSDRAAKRPGIQNEIVYRVVIVVGVLFLFGFVHAPAAERATLLWHTSTAFGWMMVMLAIAGLGFTWWARIHLGRLWSSSVTRKADHHVVDTGPYGIVRHPIYTGVIVAGLATAGLRGTGVAFAGALVLVVGWYVKARLEERFLREQLGRDAYDAYADRVPMLIPFA